MADVRNDGVSVIQVLRDLDGVADAHAAGLKNFHRALVCGTPPDAADI